MNNNLLPFDYNTWKTGNYDVVYRNGEVPLEWHWFEKAKLAMSVDHHEQAWCHDEDAINGPSDYDLMLRPKEKWIEGYLIPTSTGVFVLWENIEQAKHYARGATVLRIRWNPITKTGTIEEV